jgi:hypothetical protein
MKPFLVAMAMLLAVPLLGAATPAPSGQSYPMTCKLDKNNSTIVALGGSPYMMVVIQKGTAAAATSLQTGQCSFEDRGLRADEPSWLCTHDISVTNITMDPGAAPQITYSGPGAALANTTTIGPMKLWTFMVHSGNMAGDPCFVIDRFGP